MPLSMTQCMTLFMALRKTFCDATDDFIGGLRQFQMMTTAVEISVAQILAVMA